MRPQTTLIFLLLFVLIFFIFTDALEFIHISSILIKALWTNQPTNLKQCEDAELHLYDTITKQEFDENVTNQLTDGPTDGRVNRHDLL